MCGEGEQRAKGQCEGQIEEDDLSDESEGKSQGERQGVVLKYGKHSLSSPVSVRWAKGVGMSSA